MTAKVIALVVSAQIAIWSAEVLTPEESLTKYVAKYWSGQFEVSDVTIVQGGTSRFKLEFLKSKEIKREGVTMHIRKGARVVFYDSMILAIEAKTKRCKVGDLEAVEGTTVEFWEADHNLIRAIVTSKPVRLRGYTWPAKSNLLFYIDEKINPILYAVLLGADLKGTEYKAGQKVYVGTLGDPDAEKPGPLSLTGQDPIL